MTLPSTGAPLAFLKFFGSDFLNSTAHWKMEERGIYITLLWYAWVNDGLPVEVDQLDRMAYGTKSCWPTIASKFPVAADGKRRNPRMERDRITLLAQLEIWKARGAKGATKRWSKDAPSNASSIIQASSKQCLEDAQPIVCQISDVRCQISDTISQISNSDIKHTLNGSAVEPEFEKKKLAKSIPASEIERVWECFPRKVGKLKSLALIRKACDLVAIEHDLLDAGDAVEYMIEKVNLFADDCRKKATEPQFIAHPQTWLNGGRYLDPVVTESH